ncbi:MAG: hypothetical protein SOZ00_01455 [Tidjanibacter sp.]|nr:hypothetical protein [Tidjanibacter sp.]
MTFTLIHYTTGWNVGPTINLAALPAAGSLVRLADAAVDDDGIYYVDNLMHSEGSTVYLFVRPYTGYGRVAPITESDRVRTSIEALRKDFLAQMEALKRDSDNNIELLRNDLADTLTAVDELSRAVDNLTDNLMEQLKTIEE